MKVKDLIEKLQRNNPDAIVIAFDADAEEMLPVTGIVYGKDSVEICTDDMQE